MKKLFLWLEKLLILFLMFLIIMIVLLCNYQVLSRYVFHWSIKWTEETMRYIFCAIIFAGLCLTVKNEAMTTVTFVSSMIKKRSQFAAKVLNIVLYAIQMLFFALFSVVSVIMVIRGRLQATPYTRIPYSIIYAPLVIGAIPSFLILLYRTIWTLTGKDKNKYDQQEGKAELWQG